MVQLEPNGWGRVGDDLTPKSENYCVSSSLLFLWRLIIPVHGNDGSLVGVKVDETIAGGLTGELVRHHLEAEGISEQKQEEGVL